MNFFTSSACSALVLALLSPLAQAQDGNRSGKEVVDTVCANCHASGVNGAPKIGDKKAWSKRAQRGLSSLTDNALKGIRKMPAHGADLTLTDMEIKRAVTHMDQAPAAKK
jgi:cytochrome c5